MMNIELRQVIGRSAKNAGSRPLRRPTVKDRAGQGFDTYLDRLNEKLADKEQHLHPTKGLRRITAKRSAAALLTEEHKNIGMLRRRAAGIW